MPRPIVLHSSLAPAEAADALRRSIDPESRALLSLSGFHGKQAVIGEVAQNTFRLQRRRQFRNDFAPQFYGTLSLAATGGTTVEGYFDVSPFVKTFMRIWIGFVAVIGALFLVAEISDHFAGTHFGTDDSWLGFIVFPVMLLWGFALPKIGGLFSGGDEDSLLEYVQTALAARRAD